MKSNIALIGFMGTGKNSIGNLLAKKLKKGFIDTDALIEKETNKSIPKIFQEDGETKFRELEMDIIRKALMAKWKTTRIWRKVKWQEGKYKYVCNGNGDLEEFGGEEKIYKVKKEVYRFYYTGGLLVK